MTTQIKQKATNQKRVASKAKPVLEISIENGITKEQKKLLNHCIKVMPTEGEHLLSHLTFVNYHTLGGYYDTENSQRQLELMSAEIYAFKEDRHEGGQSYMNRKSYYVKCEFDCRIWRVDSIGKLAKLLKAIEKDVRIRYDKLEWYSR